MLPPGGWGPHHGSSEGFDSLSGGPSHSTLFRTGSKGQELVEIFPTELEAGAALEALAQAKR